MSRWLAAGAAFAGLGVALGAFASHGLGARLTPEALAVFETGARYQMYHALGLLAVGLAAERQAPSRLLDLSGWLFTAGIVLFSGSLYLLAVSGARWLGGITPLGGMAFLAGWLCLLLAARRRPKGPDA